MLIVAIWFMQLSEDSVAVATWNARRIRDFDEPLKSIGYSCEVRFLVTVVSDRLHFHEIFHPIARHSLPPELYFVTHVVVLANDERMHRYQRSRTSITGLVLKLREIIETGRLAGVALA